MIIGRLVVGSLFCLWFAASSAFGNSTVLETNLPARSESKSRSPCSVAILNKEASDLDLIARYQRNEDETALNELVQRYWLRLWDIANAHAEWNLEADDTMQEFFDVIKHCAKIFPLNRGSNFYNYLRAAAANWVRKKRRSFASQPFRIYPESALGPKDFRLLQERFADLPSWFDDSHSYFNQQILNSPYLDDQDRAILALYFWSDLNLVQINQVFERPNKTWALRRIRSAVQKLRQTFGMSSEEVNAPVDLGNQNRRRQ